MICVLHPKVSKRDSVNLYVCLSVLLSTLASRKVTKHLEVIRFLKGKAFSLSLSLRVYALSPLPGPQLGFTQDGCEIAVKTPPRKYLVGNFG